MAWNLGLGVFVELVVGLCVFGCLLLSRLNSFFEVSCCEYPSLVRELLGGVSVWNGHTVALMMVDGEVVIAILVHFDEEVHYLCCLGWMFDD
jgi:hypothetical protein